MSAVLRTLTDHASLAVLEVAGFAANVDAYAWEPDADPGTRQMRLGAHAHDVAEEPRVLGVLAPFRSADTSHLLPDLNRAGLAVVSASNTYVPLTTAGPAYEPDEPACYAPSGTGSFARLFPNDYHQAALAEHCAAEGWSPLFVLHDGEVYGRAVAEGLERAAPSAGVSIAGVATWAGPKTSRASILHSIGETSARAIALCGVIGEYTARLIVDKVGVLGRNSGGVQLVAADGFFAQRLPEQAEGMRIIVPGVRPGYLPIVGEELVDSLAANLSLDRGSVEPYAVHAAEATALLLGAIASSSGTRAEVVRNVLARTMRDTVLGSYAFDATGDVVSSDAAAGFSLYRTMASGESALEAVLVPRPELVSLARG